jgi:hypothetical protein
MNRLVITCAVAGLSMGPALLMAQTPPAGRGNAGATRRFLREIHGRRTAHRQAIA